MKHERGAGGCAQGYVKPDFFFKKKVFTEFEAAKVTTDMSVRALKLKLRDYITLKYSEMCGKDKSLH